MLKIRGNFIKSQIVEAARNYLNFYKDGKVPYQDLDTGKTGHIIFEKCGVVYVFKEIIKG